MTGGLLRIGLVGIMAKVKRDSKGKFKKGSVPNPTGRPKGAVNHTTKDLRQKISLILADKLAEFDEVYAQASPKVKLETLTALMRYAVPTLSKVEAEGSIDNNITIKVEYAPVEETGYELLPDNQEVKQIDSPQVTNLVTDIVPISAEKGKKDG